MVRLPTARPVAGGLARLLSLFAALSIIALAPVLPATTADAQLLSFPTVPKQPPRPRLPQKAGQDQMLVQADRIDYDILATRIASREMGFHEWLRARELARVHAFLNQW